MAEMMDDDDRTEEASPERRDEFRERGQVPVSRDATAVFILGAMVMFLSFYATAFERDMKKIMVTLFEMAGRVDMTVANFQNVGTSVWLQTLLIIAPFFLVTMAVSIFGTFLQTRFNWSWKKVAPDFSRMDPIQGITRMFSMNSLVELLKGLAKLASVGVVSYLILASEFERVPGILNYPLFNILGYWWDITSTLFWSVAGFLVVVAGGDYLYNFLSIERKMKMTKQEVKEEFKKREIDPHVKGRMKRMQREIATAKMVKATKTATVLITNPTHFAIALKYEIGMGAPIVVAKGVDFLALHLRQVAKENDIPLIENKPLARTLYKVCEVGDEIPETLYKAVSEIIRYVYRLKGKKLTRDKKI